MCLCVLNSFIHNSILQLKSKTVLLTNCLRDHQCMSNIKIWMNFNMLKLNDDKTKLWNTKIQLLLIRLRSLNVMVINFHCYFEVLIGRSKIIVFLFSTLFWHCFISSTFYLTCLQRL